ncbi:unnamed protein product [Paramecium pentaurelia]|uniref:Phospholipid scramblase n=1 Tax=Paramecium pentaurelia TaxID=43138 RepID=A0A8S1SFW1_9CILI|nr:unnamed protein product [Paramecium pentaurelia]
MQVQYGAVPNPQALGNAIGNAIVGQIQQYGAQFFTADPFAGINYMLIDQKPDCIECICPCVGEKKNSYQISVSEQTGLIAQQQLGIIKEESECPQRFFCQCWRALDLLFINNQNQILFKAQRIYKVPSVLCLPFERPEMVVSRDSEVIGYLKQPFMCCGRSECPLPILEEIDICDPSGNTRYFISGEFVQCGCITRMCGIPRFTGPCQYIDYDIYNPMKQKVGRIRNIFNGCAQEYCSKADKFLIEFPPQCTSQDKCLILFAAITIDYDNFEYTFCNMP